MRRTRFLVLLAGLIVLTLHASVEAESTSGTHDENASHTVAGILSFLLAGMGGGLTVKVGSYALQLRLLRGRNDPRLRKDSGTGSQPDVRALEDAVSEIKDRMEKCVNCREGKPLTGDELNGLLREMYKKIETLEKKTNRMRTSVRGLRNVPKLVDGGGS